MLKRYETLIKTHENWLKDRPTIAKNNADPLTVAVYLEEEVSELNDALLDHLSQQTKETRKEFAQELADVALYTLQLCKLFDLDLYSEMMEKMAFNQIRYDALSFSGETEYKEARAAAKLYTQQRRLKQEFYSDVY